MSLKPHEQRVVAEKAELDERLEKLANFISSSDVFRALPGTEQGLLIAQACAMVQYQTLLAARIDNFTAGAAS